MVVRHAAMNCRSLRLSSCLLTIRIVYSLVVILLCVEGTLGGINDGAYLVGQNVTLRCHTNLETDVDWMYKSDPTLTESYVYSNGVMYVSYRPRFSIDSPTKGDYNLVILDVQLSDAGHYECVEDGGLGTKHQVELIVNGGPSEVASTVSATVNTESSVSATTTVAIIVGVVGSLVFVVLIAVLVVWLLSRRKRDSRDEEQEKKPLATDKTNSLQHSELVHSPDAAHQSTDIASETETRVNTATDQITTRCHDVHDGNSSKQATVVIASVETLCVDERELGDRSEHGTNAVAYDDNADHPSAASGRQSRQSSPMTRKRSNTEDSGVDIGTQGNDDSSDSTNRKPPTNIKPLGPNYVKNTAEKWQKGTT